MNLRQMSVWIALFVLGTAPAMGAEVRILPGEVTLTRLGEVQSLVVGLFEGDTLILDLTGKAKIESEAPARVMVASDARLIARGDGEVMVTAKTAHGEARVKVKVRGAQTLSAISFANEVIPALTRAGCNSGACHGALAGKGGFKLSLRGYDLVSDYFAITRQNQSRRMNWENPGESLLLGKAGVKIPHGGGKKLAESHPDFERISRWISQGAPFVLPADPSVVALELLPKKARLSQGEKARMIATAVYSDGSRRDVTGWSRFSSSEEQSAPVDQDGWVTISGSGEAGIIALFSSQVATATIASPYSNQVSPNVYSKSPRNNFIDSLVLKKLQSLNIPPSDQCPDEEFIRRVYLDMAGVLPTSSEVAGFVNDGSPGKREKLVDALLLRPETTDYWAYKWSDMFLISTRNLGQQPVWAFYQFVRKAVADNTPWDQFARSMLTVRGSNLSRGEANFFVLHKDVTDLTETTAVTFLGMSLTCARCHNHPLEKWTQDQYWGMASLFSRIALKNGDLTGEVLVESVPQGEVLHPRKGVAMRATPLDARELDPNSAEDPRDYLAQWLTAKNNPFFARAIVNRVWKNFMGRGLFESEDDLRESNPPSNPELLDALSRRFIEDGFDMRKLMRHIVLSAAYQRSSVPKSGNESDDRYYSRFYPRRLKAEILLDACSQVTGVATPFGQVRSRAGDSKTNYAGYPKGTRALQLPDAQVSSRFLDAFGRPERAQACSCERQADSSVGQALHVFNGNTLNEKLRSPEFVGTQWIKNAWSPERMVEAIFDRGLCRKPSASELARFSAILQEAASQGEKARTEALEDVFWSVLTSREFVFNH